MNTFVSPTDEDLSGRIILVTGAAGGLGSSAAKACGSLQATVILLDKDVAGLEKVYDDIVESGAPLPAIYPFDLESATEKHYHELAETISNQYGIIHGLFHCAAHCPALGPISDLETKSWAKVLNVNLNAPFLLTQVLLPLMSKAKDASIVFVSDSSARKSNAYWGAYAVSKIGLEGFAKILAEEFQTAGKIRVNTLIPGPINSAIRQRAYPGEDSSELPLPESLDKVVCYLLGLASKGITGQVISSDYLRV
ncbi:MAG: SDR family NAD(P)-dependent oxidoreductase [Methylococcales bacterium]